MWLMRLRKYILMLLNFNINLNSHIWLEAAMLNSTALELKGSRKTVLYLRIALPRR